MVDGPCYLKPVIDYFVLNPKLLGKCLLLGESLLRNVNIFMNASGVCYIICGRYQFWDASS